MCTEAVIDSEWIDTCGKLIAALQCQPSDLVVLIPDDEPPYLDECLCNVDIERTAQKFGYEAIQDWKRGCGEWVFRLKQGKDQT